MFKRDKYNITILEEEGQTIEMIKDVLEKEEYFVKTIKNDYSSTEIYKECMKTDIVVIGNLLRKEYKFSIIKRLREVFSLMQLPILFICDVNNIKDIQKSFELGINDCIIKPINMQELIVRISNLARMKSEWEKANLSEAFLKSQIKPHFIFNVLNTASHLCTENPKNARDVLLDFSDYFRASFTFKESNGMTKFEHELEILRAYVAMEQARFKDKLKFELSVDVDEECMLPMFIIKALTENAIKHGALAKEAGGKVKVIINEAKKDNLIKVTVSDNGAGMEEEKVKEILSEEITSKNTTLKYINFKLKKLYGRGLTIKSKKDEGTVVEFSILINRSDIE